MSSTLWLGSTKSRWLPGDSSPKQGFMPEARAMAKQNASRLQGRPHSTLPSWHCLLSLLQWMSYLLLGNNHLGTMHTVPAAVYQHKKVGKEGRYRRGVLNWSLWHCWGNRSSFIITAMLSIPFLYPLGQYFPCPPLFFILQVRRLRSAQREAQLRA